MVRVLAAMHTVNLEQAGLTDYGRPGNYFERQIKRWTEQYRASQTGTLPAMEKLMEWLPANVPADDGRVALNHGDYRIDNVMFHPAESRIVAVLDWELSTLGHPWADLAYQCMNLRLPPDAAIPGLGGLDREALGIPSEEEYVARYCELTGRTGLPELEYYFAYNAFRLAGILQGIVGRVRDGTASNAAAAQNEGRVAPLAQFAYACAQRAGMEG